MELQQIGVMQIVYMVIGLCIFLIAPIVVALVWKFKKKERFTTILVGAAFFLLFALILEKPIQNVLLFPTAMGLPDHPIAQFINARPILWAFMVGLFPGIFEETGRLVAYVTLLRKRRNKETSISYGIGHGGFEVMLILGLSLFQYITYAFLINSGTYAQMIEEVAKAAPEQVDSALEIANVLANYGLSDLLISVSERIFAVLFHIAASILVFYAVKDKKKFWLYPLAIALHTIMDAIAGLTMVGVINIPTWGLEIIVAVFGVATFLGAFFLLYKKDQDTVESTKKELKSN